MQQDSPDGATTTREETPDTRAVEPVLTVSKLTAGAVDPNSSTILASQPVGRFDWPAVGVIVIIGAVFAVLAHLSAQPFTSLVPAAVLSATGCGLLITGLRKLRTFKGAGILEAALSGLLLALFQFVSALSFPGVTRGLSIDQASQAGFFSTWGLVAIFATLFSMIGAALGHLIFAPLRPLPARARRNVELATRAGTGHEEESVPGQEADLPGLSTSEDERVESEEPDHLDGMETAPDEVQPARSRMSYIISIVLLGLAPFLAGYVFAAAFDVALAFNRYDPGPFPTLRLLSGLLPWQVPLSFNLQSLNLILAWRIPFLPGNPAAFDMQTIEPFLLNAAGLSCTLLALFRLENPAGQAALKLARRNALLMEALLGLALVLPANLWIAFGLHGLLQLPNVAVLLRTLQLLNPLTFTLNLITAPLVSVITGTVIFSTRRKRTP